MADLRTAVCLPIFGDLDAGAVGELAALAEGAGWQGCFVWDHVLYDPVGRGAADATVALAAVAMRTTQLRFGPLVTPVARRRPWKLARELVSLDRLSEGRLVLGVGNGDDVDFAPVGDPAPARARAEVLDESLLLLRRLLEEDGPVTHHGATYDVEGVDLHADPVQERIPIWVAARHPHVKPLRRAASYDGVVPLWPHGVTPTPAEYAAYLDPVLGQVREERGGAGYDAVLWTRGETPTPARLQDYAEAGVTWWVEAFGPGESLDDVRARIHEGPPGG